MGAMAVLGTLSAVSTVAGGFAQKEAYEAEAQEAGMQAEAQEIERRRALNDALAMQAVMFGAQGRAPGVGSAAAITEEDIRRGEQDISLIRAGAKTTKAQLKTAGKYAMISGVVGGISSAGISLMSASKIGGPKNAATKI